MLETEGASGESRGGEVVVRETVVGLLDFGLVLFQVSQRHHLVVLEVTVSLGGPVVGVDEGVAEEGRVLAVILEDGVGDAGGLAADTEMLVGGLGVVLGRDVLLHIGEEEGEVLRLRGGRGGREGALFLGGLQQQNEGAPDGFQVPPRETHRRLTHQTHLYAGTAVGQHHLALLELSAEVVQDGAVELRLSG